MKKLLSLVMVTVFSLSISAFALAEVKTATDSTAPKMEEQKAPPAAEKKATKKKHTRKKKKTAKKPAAGKAEKAPEQPAEKK